MNNDQRQTALREARDFYDSFRHENAQWGVSIPDAIGHVGKLIDAYDGLEENVLAENGVLEQFKSHGMKASYHYADDSCKEWGAGDRQKRSALKLFDDNKGLQERMRVIAKGFLWTLSLERKAND